MITDLLPAFGYFALAVFGLLVGSFLNVVIWRVPRGESIVRPPSACPRCGARIRPRDNIPVVSWLLLRGRCRDCGTRISPRYPVVEAATALLFVLVAVRMGWQPALPAFLYLAAVGFALALIDVAVHRLPDVIVLPSYLVVATLLTVASATTGNWSALIRAALSALVLWVVYALLMVVRPGGMGLGDVKLAPVLGAGLGWLGWGTLVVGGFAAFALGGVYAVGLLATRRATRATRVPFGPWMVAGAALGFAVGESLWSGYLVLVGLGAG